MNTKEEIYQGYLDALPMSHKKTMKDHFLAGYEMALTDADRRKLELFNSLVDELKQSHLTRGPEHPSNCATCKIIAKSIMEQSND